MKNYQRRSVAGLRISLNQPHRSVATDKAQTVISKFDYALNASLGCNECFS